MLNIKSEQTGLTRAEYEYEIPLEEGEEILATLCGFIVEKTRYKRTVGGKVWEIDVFHGDNDGLVTAEVGGEERGVRALVEGVDAPVETVDVDMGIVTLSPIEVAHVDHGVTSPLVADHGGPGPLTGATMDP